MGCWQNWVVTTLVLIVVAQTYIVLYVREPFRFWRKKNDLKKNETNNGEFEKIANNKYGNFDIEISKILPSLKNEDDCDYKWLKSKFFHHMENFYRSKKYKDLKTVEEARIKYFFAWKEKYYHNLISRLKIANALNLKVQFQSKGVWLNKNDKKKIFDSAKDIFYPPVRGIEEIWQMAMRSFNDFNEFRFKEENEEKNKKENDEILNFFDEGDKKQKIYYDYLE